MSVKVLASLAGKAQFLRLAIPVVRFSLRELHNVVKSAKSWSGTVKVTCQLTRDLEWWTQVITHHNGALIWKHIENAYIHCDSSNYGWGGVLKNCVKARGFWTMPDLEEHITFTQRKVVRCAIEAFLPELEGKRFLLHEDIQPVIGVLTHLTSKSPTMLCELRKLFLLVDTYDIKICTRYIRSSGQLLGRQPYPNHIQITWDIHTINRFASSTKKKVPRYNAMWRDGTAEAVGSLHLSDLEWPREINDLCSPPWELLDDLVAKLRQSGDYATVIALY